MCGDEPRSAAICAEADVPSMTCRNSSAAAATPRSASAAPAGREQSRVRGSPSAGANSSASARSRSHPPVYLISRSSGRATGCRDARTDARPRSPLDSCHSLRRISNAASRAARREIHGCLPPAQTKRAHRSPPQMALQRVEARRAPGTAGPRRRTSDARDKGTEAAAGTRPPCARERGLARHVRPDRRLAV